MAGIHAAVLVAMKDIAERGIAKDLKANIGGAVVPYRGIESAMNEMNGVLWRAGLIVEVTYSDLKIEERAKGDPKDGKATRFVSLCGAFKFIAEDGSSVTFTAYGEAMDSGDKAVTKAQSVSFRTALFQQFVVPFMAIDPEADDDYEGDDEFRKLMDGIYECDTDAKALAYWNENKKALADNPDAYAAFKDAVADRRKALGSKK